MNMDDRHTISEPRLKPSAKKTWIVDIYRKGVQDPVDTIEISDETLPPRVNKRGKVVWQLPDDGNRVPSFAVNEQRRIMELFKDRKKSRKKKASSNRSLTGNVGENEGTDTPENKDKMKNEGRNDADSKKGSGNDSGSQPMDPIENGQSNDKQESIISSSSSSLSSKKKKRKKKDKKAKQGISEEHDENGINSNAKSKGDKKNSNGNINKIGNTNDYNKNSDQQQNDSEKQSLDCQAAPSSPSLPLPPPGMNTLPQPAPGLNKLLHPAPGLNTLPKPAPGLNTTLPQPDQESFTSLRIDDDDPPQNDTTNISMTRSDLDSSFSPPLHDSQHSISQMLLQRYIVIPEIERPKHTLGSPKPSLAVPAAKAFVELYYPHITHGLSSDLAAYYTSTAQKSISVGGAHSVVASRPGIVLQLSNFSGSTFAVRGVVSQDTFDNKGAHVLVTGVVQTTLSGLTSFAHSISLVPKEIEYNALSSFSGDAQYSFQIHNDALSLLTGDVAE